MGRIDFDDAIATAQRFKLATEKQVATRDEVSEAKGYDRRRDFMLASGRMAFETVLEESDLFPVRYFSVGQLVARTVGRIHLAPIDGYGDGYGTGFLVAPNVLLTNQHVLRTEAWAQAATVTMDAEDGVDALPRPPKLFRLNPRKLYVADQELDFCFVAVEPQSVDGAPLSEYGHLRLFGETGKIVRGEFASIIQHPNGRQKHLAIRNNKMIVYVYDEDLTAEEKAKNNFLYYTTDTLAGSSGSPVLSDQWYVVALHRRGVPETKIVKGKLVVMRRNKRPAFADDPDEVINYTANEGIRISRILDRLVVIGDTRDQPYRTAAQALAPTLARAAGSVSDGPVSFPSAVLPMALRDRRAKAVLPEQGLLELVRRRIDVFPDGLGYDEDFLDGFPIPLPTPTAALVQELALRTDDPTEYLLHFRHFTTAMHAGRRMPIFAAVNISGKQRPPGGMPKQRPQWSFDPRIAEEHQPDDTLFSQMLQRGHMAARDYVYWGKSSEQTQADIHSFTLTNVCPQIASFNGNREWYKVERDVVKGARGDGAKVSEFVGPILDSSDPDYDELRGAGSDANVGSRIQIPIQFWKIVFWVENGALLHKAFILNQRDELDEAGPLEFDLDTPDGVDETTVAAIEELTGLKFAGL